MLLVETIAKVHGPNSAVRDDISAAATSSVCGGQSTCRGIDRRHGHASGRGAGKKRG